MRIRLKSQKASAIIFVILITLVMTVITAEFTTLLVQQQKVYILERQQLELNKIKNNLLLAVKYKLIGYHQLDKIPSVFQVVTSFGKGVVNLKQQGVLNYHSTGYNYKIYRIDLLVDGQYASKLHVYVAVCEDVGAQTELETIYLSNYLN